MPAEWPPDAPNWRCPRKNKGHDRMGENPGRCPSQVRLPHRRPPRRPKATRQGRKWLLTTLHWEMIAETRRSRLARSACLAAMSFLRFPIAPGRWAGCPGEVSEWLKEPHSKCGQRATAAGVRIPPSPIRYAAVRQKSASSISTFEYPRSVPVANARSTSDT